MTTREAVRCFLVAVAVLGAQGAAHAQGGEALGHAYGEMAGEVTQTSVILQSRLTRGEPAYGIETAGAAGVACFELSETPDFAAVQATPWLDALPGNDFIVKTVVSGLKPGTRYYYRLVYGPDRDRVERGEPRTFRTLAPVDAVEPVRFVVVTGMNYYKFHHGPDAYAGPDKAEGYPALEAMRALKPDFFVGTGDNVYYDSPQEGRAETVEQLRRKWHEQFIQPRYVRFFAEVPTYWEKDDHDYRYNDADATGDRLPSHETGIRIFREQVPVVDPADPQAPTYRTHRINRLLQLWFVEGRDYRSPNKMPDGPDKTLWGAEQLAWLKRTLLESDAPFKILISPTPMVGPDDAYKTDNHVNLQGFHHEGEAFFAWLKENGFLDKGFYIVCGDRHWQYHSIHQSGFEEFSTGALVDANSRVGRAPGDPESTDPEAKVRQPFTYAEPTGGFLEIAVAPEGERARADFTFRDEHGTVLYTSRKEAAMSPSTAQTEVGLTWRETPGDSVELRRGDTVLWAFHYGPDAITPYFHPVSLADGSNLTWLSPPDHHWHRALWFSWKMLNGVNFWEEDPATGKPVGATEVESCETDLRPDFSAVLRLKLRYRHPQEGVILNEARTVTISSPDADGKFTLDWRAEFAATERPVVLEGGTSGGGYAGLSYRVAEGSTDWRITDSEGRSVDPVAGVGFPPQVHGQPARWMDFSMKTAAGSEGGLTILDHPANPRHPQPWFCILQREPHEFGYLSPAPLYAEPFTVEPGKPMTLRYRIVVHPGRPDPAEIDRNWQAFAEAQGA